MAVLVIVRPEQISGEVVVARRARLRERLVARIAARRLDGELARGVAPQARASLALRAQALGEQATRDALAQGLMLALNSARCPPAPCAARVPIAHKQVLAAASELEELAERLLAPGPVAARGLAQVRLLLTDGAGPLYRRGAGSELRSLVARACASLEPQFQW